MAPMISLYTLLAREVSLEEAVKLAADAGFDAVDIRMREDGIHITPDISDAEACRIRWMVEDSGLHVSGLTTYWEVGRVDRAAAKTEIAGIAAALDTAAALDAGFVRISSADYDRAYDYEVCRAAFRDQLMRVAEMAAEYGIIITPE